MIADLDGCLLSIADEKGEPHLTSALLDDLAQTLRGCTGTVVLEGRPGTFCAGLDLALVGRLPEAAAEDTLARFASLLDALVAHTGSVIAVVDGEVMGGGVGLVAICDRVLATPRSRFSLPEVVVGLVPAIVLPPLVDRVGRARARWLAGGARPWSAREALACGLVDEIADPLEPALRRDLARLKRADPVAIALARRLVRETGDEDYTERAAAAFAGLVKSSRVRRRITRFLAGGAPWEEDACSP